MSDWENIIQVVAYKMWLYHIVSTLQVSIIYGNYNNNYINRNNKRTNLFLIYFKIVWYTNLL